MLRPKDRKISGFTLVEMAIVLVIIGIILAGVMKGRDIVRGAQVKQFSQQFAQKWATVAQTYYDKTGQHLLDGNGNGNGVAAGGAANTVPNGRMDGNLNGVINTLLTGTVATLRNVGITPCTLIKSKLTQAAVSDITPGGTAVSCNNNTNLVATTVEGEYTGSRVVEVDLTFIRLTMGGNTMGRNCVVLYGVPIDVAIGLDTAIDGARDGRTGACVNLVAGGGTTPRITNANTGTAATVLVTQPWPPATGPVANQHTVVALILDY